MSGATYLTSPAKAKSQKKRGFMPYLALVLAFFVGILSLGSGLLIKHQEAEAGPIEWVVCEFAGEGSLPYFAYQVAFTDNVAYMFNSKSAISAGTDDVASGLNLLLSVTHDFNKTNEEIMGTGINASREYEGSLNGGQKVNPYDRFGMAGLYWSSYGGEWNYLKVDICNGDGTPTNMRIGAFYDDRLAPMTTWGGISQSNDVRSLAAAQKGLVVAYDWVNIVANGVFNITKAVVAITNALIGLAFSDILGAVGLTDLVVSQDGIFSKLYTGIYLPLILIIMLVMATWAFWNGIVKRAYRRTLGGIAQSIGMFILAAIVAFQPAFFITLPNNIAVIGQSLIVNTLSAGIYSGDGLCAVGGTYVVDKDGNYVPASTGGDGRVNTDPGGPSDVTNVQESGNLLEQASKSMQSVIGCQLWYTYVLKPWVSGQYGTDFTNLWAKGHADGAFGDGAQELKNDNEAWVGDAWVPLGGGYALNNWALFQISTQTNAHVPIGTEEPARSTYTDGVANDWWRIVDAVSNYNETTQANGIPSGNECQTNTPIEGTGHCNTYSPEATQPVDSTIPDVSKKPTDYWQNWIGAKPGDRLMAAVGSVIPAIFGNLAPLLFAGMSVTFALGIAIAMTFAPIFLLLGSWPGNGWRMFKEWGQLVLNLTVKRIIAGVLLVLSLILISMVLNLVRDNWFVSLIVILVVSIALVKLRSRIFEMVAGIFTFNFASGSFRDTTVPAMAKFGQRAKQGAQFVGRAGTAAAMGAKVAQDSGGNAMQGALKGVKAETRQAIFRSPTLNTAFADMQSYGKNKTEEQQISHNEICAYCGKPLWRAGQDDAVFNGGMDQDGNWVCLECMDNPTFTASGLDPYEFGARRVTRQYITDEDEYRYGGLSVTDGDASELRRTPRETVTVGESVMDAELKDIQFRNSKTGEQSGDLNELLAKAFRREVDNYRETGAIPQVPETLKPHMTKEARDVMEQLWRDPNPQAMETVALAYSHAMVQYSYTLDNVNVGDLSGDIRKGIQGDVNAVFGSIVTALNEEERDRNADSPK